MRDSDSIVIGQDRITKRIKLETQKDKNFHAGRDIINAPIRGGNITTTNMSTKIIASLIAIAAVAAVAGGATVAYFSDVETSNANTFSAGTLNLQLDGDATEKFEFKGVKPTDTGAKTWDLKNTSTDVDGVVTITDAVTGHEDGCHGAESTVDTDCATLTTAGELSPAINVVLCEDATGNGVCGETGDVQLYSGTLADLVAGPIATVELDAAADKKVTMTWIAPENGANDNKWQGDTATVDLTFTLNQAI